MFHSSTSKFTSGGLHTGAGPIGLAEPPVKKLVYKKENRFAAYFDFDFFRQY